MKNKLFRNILIFVTSIIAFLVLTLPFHQILSVFTLSEVRPSAVLYPFLSISFGLPSIIGITVANFLSDFINGYSTTVLIEGFIPQFLYGFVPYVMWKKMTKGEEHVHRLDSVKRVMKFVLICFVFAVLSGVLTSLIISTNFNVPLIDVWFFIFLNNFDISVMLGCPLMIISNQIISKRSGSERVLSTNEKIILFASLAQIIGLFIMILVMYQSGIKVGTYDIWNSIYICSIVLVNLLMLIALLIMFKLEKSNQNKVN